MVMKEVDESPGEDTAVANGEIAGGVTGDVFEGGKIRCDHSGAVGHRLDQDNPE
jgi:hypothetical protein